MKNSKNFKDSMGKFISDHQTVHVSQYTGYWEGKLEKEDDGKLSWYVLRSKTEHGRCQCEFQDRNIVEIAHTKIPTIYISADTTKLQERHASWRVNMKDKLIEQIQEAALAGDVTKVAELNTQLVQLTKAENLDTHEGRRAYILSIVNLIIDDYELEVHPTVFRDKKQSVFKHNGNSQYSKTLDAWTYTGKGPIGQLVFGWKSVEDRYKNGHTEYTIVAPVWAAFGILPVTKKFYKSGRFSLWMDALHEVAHIIQARDKPTVKGETHTLYYCKVLADLIRQYPYREQA